MKRIITLISVIVGAVLLNTAAGQSYPREKLYIHTDKNTYVYGDTLWFNPGCALTKTASRK